MASRLAALCFGVENRFLNALKSYLIQSVPGINISVLMFDGLVVNLPNLEAKAALEQCLSTYNEGAPVKVAIKKWPSITEE